jgi:SAM-dependent methyltransferase
MLTEVVHKLRGLEWRIWGRRLGWGRRYEGSSWSQSYADGKWDFMRSPEESQRYSALASCCLRGPQPSILDIACGEGILLDHFQKMGFAPARYLGLDIASTAIDKARVLHPEFLFEVADAETYKPEARFDVIVLNECLYYFRRPLKVLRTLETGLADGGVFVVSTYHPANAAQRYRRYWDNLTAQYECIQHQAITNSKDITWNIGVFRPRGAT